MTEPIEQTRPRRTWLHGYRASDVEIALARAGLVADQLRQELEAAGQRARAMQTEIDELHGRVDGFRRREAELDTAVSQLRQQRDAIDREAVAHSASIVADAERRAAALQTEALKELAALQEQVEDLLGLRTKVMQALRKAGDGIGRTLERLAPEQREDAQRHGDSPPAADARPADDLTERLSRWTTRDEG